MKGKAMDSLRTSLQKFGLDLAFYTFGVFTPLYKRSNNFLVLSDLVDEASWLSLLLFSP